MKYIFIDSNQYRHLFSKSEGFSDEVFQLLLNLIDHKHIKLLLPQQTKEEVERNRFRSWPENAVSRNESKKQKLIELIDRVDKDFSAYKSCERLKKEFKKEIKKIEKEKVDIYKSFTESRSKANQKLKQLLQRTDQIGENETIRQAANIRNQKGNPPYDDGLGDCIIWESLLAYLPKHSHLIFVAHDNKAWGDGVFDRWLEKEFKDRIKGKIFYSNKLSDIPDLTSQEQEKIRREEIENLKQNAIADFVNSPSFVAAGARASQLLKFKNLLTTDDLKEILTASITNHEIYQSFFTSIPLGELVTGKDGYAREEIESIDENLWKQFKVRHLVDLKRQVDEKQSEEEINIKDIPF